MPRYAMFLSFTMLRHTMLRCRAADDIYADIDDIGYAGLSRRRRHVTPPGLLRCRLAAAMISAAAACR